jgi:hypothetical protein
MIQLFPLAMQVLSMLGLDIFGCVALFLSVDELKDWKRKIKLMILDKYVIFSILVELIALFLLIFSFFFPWFYVSQYPFFFIGIKPGPILYYIYIFEVYNIKEIMRNLLYYSYLLGIFLLLLKTITKRKFPIRVIIETIQVLMLIPAVYLFIMITVHPPILFAWVVDSGYCLGAYLFLIGLLLFTFNGVQISYFTWLRKYLIFKRFRSF